MQPVQITVRDLPSSPALEDHIRKKAQKLSQFYHRINSCRIVITLPQKHKHQGKLYCVRIDLTVPGKELVVNRKLDEDVYVAIRDAFQALQRQLEAYACKRRGDIKKHEFASNRGKIKRLFTDEGYGFIQDINGTELYFSPANLSNLEFAQLKVGDQVEFISVTASDGWQAHHVTRLKQNNFENAA
ncbi:MAG: ribosome hibernation-promoting factor, HPF/YfiA family [Gammaproteobacteria bacterium]